MFPKDMLPVIIESPFAGGMLQVGPRKVFLSEIQNVSYLRACMHDCLVTHHEAPYASHGLYTQPGVLRDDIPEERTLGMGAGFCFAKLATRRVFYLDRGMSKGMIYGLEHALDCQQELVFRRLLGEWDLGFTLDLPLHLASRLEVAGFSIESL